MWNSEKVWTKNGPNQGIHEEKYWNIDMFKV